MGYTGKTFRDAVHGDIFVENRFLQIIDTAEFQRLRRIKQLAVADLVFPSANHTRFSHSIGCFHIMQRIVAHFKMIFSALGITISKHEEDVALLAALLHDIGHGPFSHAFEQLDLSQDGTHSHEKWTYQIITNPDGEICKKIEYIFGEGTAKDTADLIVKHRAAKNRKVAARLDCIDLFSVLASLVSSQLDADRLDYLLRDADGCGVSFGRIDIARIISGMRISVYRDDYVICILEKHIDDIETYLMARYHMQSVVYYHDLKVQAEQIIVKILKRAQELYLNGNLNCTSEDLCNLLSGKKIDVSTYCRLDDTIFWYYFQEWAREGDYVLSELCRSLIYRRKFKKIEIGLNACDKLRGDVCRVLCNGDLGISQEALKSSCFWIEKKSEFSAYKVQRENIWVQRSTGELVDISICSPVLDTTREDILTQCRERLWVNFNLMNYVVNNEALCDEVSYILNGHRTSEKIEVEKKYICASRESADAVLRYFTCNQTAYDTKDCGITVQQDFYYDTDEYSILHSGYSLRVREKEGAYELTVKAPASSAEIIDGSSERFEYSRPVAGNDLSSWNGFLEEHIPALRGRANAIKVKLVVRNNRRVLDVNLIGATTTMELVIDDIRYSRNVNAQFEKDDGSVAELQVELELKSDYAHKPNLKRVTDDLRQKVAGLYPVRDTKYIRGLAAITGMMR